MKRLLAIAALAVALSSCRGDGLPGEPGPPVEEVYAKITQALLDHGDVAIVSVASQEDDADRSRTRLMWLDAEAGRARVESRNTYQNLLTETRGIEIVAAGMRYFFSEGQQSRGQQSRPVVVCAGVPSAVLGLYTQCPGVDSLTATTTAREDAKFAGRRALVLVTRGSYYGIDSKITYDERLYVDATSFLPIARITKTHDSLGDTNSRSEIRFIHTFVDRDTLPADWFDPSSALYETIDLPISPP